jgi:hypothetical protein
MRVKFLRVESQNCTVINPALGLTEPDPPRILPIVCASAP